MITWKRTKAKKPLIEVIPYITSEDKVFNYAEIDNKIYIRYTFVWWSFDKKDFNKYLNPLITNGQIEEVPSDLSIYLNDALKKAQKKG